MATTECPHCSHVIVDVASTAFACGTCPECGGELASTPTREAKLRPAATLVRPAAASDAAAVAKGGARPDRGELDALLGAVLGGCRLEGVLGRGAMGVVYQARQLSLDRAVAVKVIRRELCSDPGLLQRFQREARMIGQFSTQHVVAIHEVGQESGHHFLVMELVAGGNLLTRVTALPGGRLPPADAIRLLIEAAQGLQEAERLGIIHRDIKPENLLIDLGGRLKIADFGISRSLNADVLLTRTEMVIGTPLYMSPEQCRGEKVDARTDMYALGATFCHLLAGRPPLRENSVPELLRRKTTIESLSPRKLADDGTIPESLSRVIERMTALDRDDRYANFADLVADLERVERGEVIAPLVRRSARQARARRLAWGVVGALLLAALALGADWGWRAWRREQSRLDGGVGGVTAERLEQESTRLRSTMRERPELVTQEMVASARSLASRASGASAEARALSDLCDDAERLVSFRATANQLGAPRFAPPFVEVGEHVARLRSTANAATGGRKGPELRAQVDGELARRTESLLAQSQVALASAATSLEQRARAGSPSAELLASAQQDLDALRRGADGLAATFPDAAAALAATLPPARIERIASDLRRMELAVGAVSDDAGLAQLAELESQFRSGGPKNYDFVDAMKVRDRLAAGSPVKGQFEKFASTLDRGGRALGRLDDLRTEKPAVRAPFDELAAFAARCRVAVEPLEPDWYAEFFRAELARRVEGDLEPARAAYAELAGRATTERGALAGGGDPAPFAALLDQVVAARRNLVALFPGHEAEWDAAFPDVELAAARTEVDAASARKSAGMESSRALDELAQQLDAIRSSAEWRAAKGGFEPALAAAKARLVTAGTGTGSVEALARVGALEQRAARWSAHAAALAQSLARVAGATHDLAAAESALDPLAGDGLADAGVADAQAGVRALRSGFTALFDHLDDRAAADAFTEAARRLAPDAGARKYADDCRKRLGELDAIGRTMQAIPAGRVRLPGSSGPEEVGGFFLDRCEVSIGEFTAFLEQLKADRAAWEPRVAELPGFAGADRDAIDRRLLAMPGCYAGVARLNERLPIEQVSYAQALLYARLRGKELPAFAEWWLAAKGSLTQLRDHRRFPCSDNVSATLRQLSQPDALVWGRRTPMAVDEGGIAIGFGGGGVHHLAGNVEEWTRAEGDAAGGRLEAKVVGGGYTDGAEQEEYLAGEKVRVADARGAPERRVGFRTVLRPRDFFAAAGLAPDPTGR